MISTTKDPALASRSVSWASSTGTELDDSALLSRPPIAGELRYPAAKLLPTGLLFTPRRMEEKWVLAYRPGKLLAARSWTGTVEAVAEAVHDGEALTLRNLRIAEPSALRAVGDPLQIFDWMVRSHALQQRLPIPLDEIGAQMLEAVPMMLFSAFGSVAFCAAVGWSPPPPTISLRSNGELRRAVRAKDSAKVKALVQAGEAVDAPSTHWGYTPFT